MPKRYSSAQVTKVLIKVGFTLVTQRGSHQKYRITGERTLTVIVPARHRVIPVGTFRSILRQANMTNPEFERYL